MGLGVPVDGGTAKRCLSVKGDKLHPARQQHFSEDGDIRKVSVCLCTAVSVCGKEREHSKTGWLGLLRIGGLPYQAGKHYLGKKLTSGN